MLSSRLLVWFRLEMDRTKNRFYPSMMVLFGLHYLSFVFLFEMRMCSRYHHAFKVANYDKGGVGEKLKSLCNREKICQSFTNIPKVLLLKAGF